MKLWTVHRFVGVTEYGVHTVFDGVFSTREKALARCADYRYAIAPIDLDKELPTDDVVWPGWEYPLADHIEEVKP